MRRGRFGFVRSATSLRPIFIRPAQQAVTIPGSVQSHASGGAELYASTKVDDGYPVYPNGGVNTALPLGFNDYTQALSGAIIFPTDGDFHADPEAENKLLVPADPNDEIVRLRSTIPQNELERARIHARLRELNSSEPAMSVLYVQPTNQVAQGRRYLPENYGPPEPVAFARAYAAQMRRLAAEQINEVDSYLVTRKDGYAYNTRPKLIPFQDLTPPDYRAMSTTGPPIKDGVFRTVPNVPYDTLGPDSNIVRGGEEGCPSFVEKQKTSVPTKEPTPTPVKMRFAVNKDRGSTEESGGAIIEELEPDPQPQAVEGPAAQLALLGPSAAQSDAASAVLAIPSNMTANQAGQVNRQQVIAAAQNRVEVSNAQLERTQGVTQRALVDHPERPPTVSRPMTESLSRRQQFVYFIEWVYTEMLELGTEYEDLRNTINHTMQSPAAERQNLTPAALSLTTRFTHLMEEINGYLQANPIDQTKLSAENQRKAARQIHQIHRRFDTLLTELQINAYAGTNTFDISNQREYETIWRQFDHLFYNMRDSVNTAIANLNPLGPLTNERKRPNSLGRFNIPSDAANRYKKVGRREYGPEEVEVPTTQLVANNAREPFAAIPGDDDADMRAVVPMPTVALPENAFVEMGAIATAEGVQQAVNEASRPWQGLDDLELSDLQALIGANPTEDASANQEMALALREIEQGETRVALMEDRTVEIAQELEATNNDRQLQALEQERALIYQEIEQQREEVEQQRYEVALLNDRLSQREQEGATAIARLTDMNAEQQERHEHMLEEQHRRLLESQRQQSEQLAARLTTHFNTALDDSLQQFMRATTNRELVRFEPAVAPETMQVIERLIDSTNQNNQQLVASVRQLHHAQQLTHDSGEATTLQTEMLQRLATTQEMLAEVLRQRNVPLEAMQHMRSQPQDEEMEGLRSVLQSSSTSRYRPQNIAADLMAVLQHNPVNLDAAQRVFSANNRAVQDLARNASANPSTLGHLINQWLLKNPIVAPNVIDTVMTQMMPPTPFTPPTGLRQPIIPIGTFTTKESANIAKKRLTGALRNATETVVKEQTFGIPSRKRKLIQNPIEDLKSDQLL